MTKQPTKTSEKSANLRAGEAASAVSPLTKPASNRAERAAERREAIIEAAMDEFIARGFAATRLDDVASRAGVAKGTIYLHFKDKEALFEELIRTAIVPLVSRLAASPPPIGGSVRDMVEGFAAHLHPGGDDDAAGRHRAPDRCRRSALSGDRRLLLPRSSFARVWRACGPRSRSASRAVRSGTRSSRSFPQILIAPAMIAVIWQSLFSRHAPLDAVEMFRVHLDLIFGERRTT